MRKLIISTISDIDEAHKIWDEISPHKTIDDEWDYRFVFFKFLPYKLSFLIAQYDGEIVALLPLQLNNRVGLLPPYAPVEGNFYEFFGGDDTDENLIFTKCGFEKVSTILLKKNISDYCISTSG